MNSKSHPLSYFLKDDKMTLFFFFGWIEQATAHWLVCHFCCEANTKPKSEFLKPINDWPSTQKVEVYISNKYEISQFALSIKSQIFFFTFFKGSYNKKNDESSVTFVLDFYIMSRLLRLKSSLLSMVASTPSPPRQRHRCTTSTSLLLSELLQPLTSSISSLGFNW